MGKASASKGKGKSFEELRHALLGGHEIRRTAWPAGVRLRARFDGGLGLEHLTVIKLSGVAGTRGAMEVPWYPAQADVISVDWVAYQGRAGVGE